MLPRIREVAPQPSLLASDADFETLAWFAFNTADAPMATFAVSIREKILSKLRDSLAQ